MKNLLLFLVVFLSLVSCGTSMKAISTVEEANEDEFFVLISTINSEDTENEYERVKEEDGISPDLYKQISAAVRETEGHYAIGSVYQTMLYETGPNKERIPYKLFLLDTVSEYTQFLTTPGGRRVEVKLGTRASKWVLYRMVPKGGAATTEENTEGTTEENAAPDS
ncbi:MAG: hypothetical protein MdMp014T_2371 [Treponematales bacterium]